MQRKTRIEISMGGKVRPLLFDFTFLDFLTDAVPLAELDIIGAAKPWRLIPIIALAGLQSGAAFEGKKTTKDVLDLPTVTGWVESMDAGDAAKILEGYTSAMGFIGTALGYKSPEVVASPVVVSPAQ